MGAPYLVKVILAGKEQAGKSMLAEGLAGRGLEGEYLPTIGIEIHRRGFEYRGKEFYVQFWDPAGQERFRSIVQCIHRGATTHIYVFDLSSPESFSDIPSWLTLMRPDDPEGKLFILYGNDKGTPRCLSFESAALFALHHGMLYIEASAAREAASGYLLKLIAELYLYKLRERLTAWESIGK